MSKLYMLFIKVEDLIIIATEADADSTIIAEAVAIEAEITTAASSLAGVAGARAVAAMMDAARPSLSH